MRLTLLILSCLTFLASAHQPYDEDVGLPVGEAREFPSLTMDDIKGLLDMISPSKPSFPSLTQTQREFAVNPQYRSFSDPRFKDVEENGEPDIGRLLNDETVEEEPLSRADEHRIPKKASELPVALAQVSRFEFDRQKMDDIYFTTTVAASSALAVFAIIGAGFCYRRVRRNSKASEDVEYPAYGISGAGKDNSPTSGTDRKLAQNAQMYHYQHQKQQMLAFDSAKGAKDGNNSGVAVAAAAIASDCESDDGEEGDYTVYECPGLAPAGEMEVHNPLFHDEPTPKAK